MLNQKRANLLFEECDCNGVGVRGQAPAGTQCEQDKRNRKAHTRNPTVGTERCRRASHLEELYRTGIGYSRKPPKVLPCDWRLFSRPYRTRTCNWPPSAASRMSFTDIRA